MFFHCIQNVVDSWYWHMWIAEVVADMLNCILQNTNCEAIQFWFESKTLPGPAFLVMIWTNISVDYFLPGLCLCLLPGGYLLGKASSNFLFVGHLLCRLLKQQLFFSFLKFSTENLWVLENNPCVFSKTKELRSDKCTKEWDSYIYFTKPLWKILYPYTWIFGS